MSWSTTIRIGLIVVGALVAGTSAANQFRTVAAEPAILYDAPSAKSKRMFVLAPGYPLQVLVAVEGWTKVRDSGGTIGWVEAKALTPKRNVVVRAAVAEVRASADAGGKVAYRVGRGVLLEWVETMPGGWVRVRHAEAGPGFAQAADLWGS